MSGSLWSVTAAHTFGVSSDSALSDHITLWKGRVCVLQRPKRHQGDQGSCRSVTGYLFQTKSSQNGLGWTSEDHPVQPACRGQGHFSVGKRVGLKVNLA